MVVCACALAVVSAAAAQPTENELGQKLERHVKTLKHDRQVIRFFARHDWLLIDPRFAPEARRQLALHRRSLSAAKKRAARVAADLKRLHVVRKRQEQARRRAALRRASPRKAICAVFGGRHCKEALAVAHCESRLTTTAANGQYLGLFQMGSTPRRIYGHGASAYEQARAAYAYFVDSGRDWSPWSCKPWW